MKYSIVSALLAQTVSASNWSWGWCGWTPPETTVTNFDMSKF